MKALTCAAAGALFAAAVPAFAQSVEPTAPPPQTIAKVADTGMAVLRTGTPIALKLAEELTTKGKKLRVGQRFHLSVAEDVKVGETTVIPSGSPAEGEITDVRNKGMWGKSGHIGAHLLYVSVNGRQIRLSGTFDDKGVTGTAGVVAAIALVPIAGFFTTGTSAKLPLGGAVSGFVDEDVPLAFAATPAQQPMVVTPTGIIPPAEPVEATITPVPVTPSAGTSVP